MLKFPKYSDAFCADVRGLDGDLTIAAGVAARVFAGLAKFCTDVVSVARLAAPT